MLQNAPSLAIVAVDTEENERLKFGVNYSVYSVTSLEENQALNYTRGHAPAIADENPS